MAQLIIYAHREVLSGRKQIFSDVLHSCVTSALGLPQDKRFHRFITLERDDFIHPANRSDNYTIIEIQMFAGRSTKTKKELIRMLFGNCEEHLGISPQDLEITIYESSKENWGIRGKPADELSLNYTIEK
jgi:phenylpyruvate tautomerase PptA (4-oxalocrotonate tautomerase family)